jgi:fibronectin-binding autotransporter adhesin
MKIYNIKISFLLTKAGASIIIPHRRPFSADKARGRHLIGNLAAAADQRFAGRHFPAANVVLPGSPRAAKSNVWRMASWRFMSIYLEAAMDIRYCSWQKDSRGRNKLGARVARKLFSAQTERRCIKSSALLSAVAAVGLSHYVLPAESARAANTPDAVVSGATDLGTNTTATYTTPATTTSDVEFLAGTTYANANSLGLSAALSIGTMDDFNATAISISGTGLLTLSTAANSVAPNAADLFYVLTGASLSIQTSGGISFTPTGNVDDAGVLSLGTSPVTITAGTTLSFTGVGATTVGGNIAATTGAVAINNAGGTVTFSGANLYTGATTIYNGGLLSADVTSSLGNGGAVAINSGATLRTLSTSGGSLGGGAISLNNGTIQVGNGSVAAVSASLPGVLTFTGATTINLQDNGNSTAALTLAGATTGLVRNTNNAATLILNGATALNGTTDTLTVTNYSTTGTNATYAGILTNGILPSYEVGTAAGSTNADFLTSVAGGANGTSVAGSPLKVYSSYTQKTAGAAQTFTSTTVYELGTGASTITSAQTAYGIKFDSGATLALGTQTQSIGGGSSGLGGIIFNGTGDAITGGTLDGSGNNGEVDIYTASAATISSNFTSGSGGGAFTFFGPGVLTLSGANVTSTNGSGVIAFNGSVNDNLTTGFVMPTGAPFVLNNGTLKLNQSNNNNLNGISGVNLTVNSPGVLDLAGSSQIIYRLLGGSSATLPGGTITSSTSGSVLTLNNTGNNDTFYGNITSANLGLTKLSTNTETLSGLENYTGTTTVNGGQLTFAPVVAGVNDSLGVLSFAQGLGTVQSTYQGTGTTTLTFSNLTARTAGAEANFVSSGGTNGTTNKIVPTLFNGATPPAGTLLDRGYFFGGNAYATVDAGGFLRAYAATDTNGATAAAGTSNIANVATNNVFVNGTQSAQTTASVNTLDIATGGVVITLASSATLSTNGLLSNGISTITGGATTGLDTTTAGGELVVRSSVNQFTLNVPILDNGGSSLTTSGNIILQAANSYTGLTTIDSGTVYLGNQTGTGLATGDLGSSSGVVLNTGGGLFVNRSNAYSFTNPITTGSLSSGSTVTQAGAGALTLGNISNTGNPNGTLNITRNVSTGAFTLGTITGIGTLADNSTSGATTPTTVNQSGTGLTIATVSGASGSEVKFGGDGTGSTTVANLLATPGQLVDVTSGTVAVNTGRNTTSNLEVDGGVLNVPAAADRLSLAGSTTGQTLSITGGTVNVTTGNYGLRLNGDNAGNGAGTAGNKLTATQTGGTLNILHGGQYASFNLGSTSANQTSTYSLSSGTLSAVTNNGYVDLGADTAGTSTTAFNLSGGKLLVSDIIEGDQGTGAKQSFVWTGGQLSAFSYLAANLTSTSGTAVSASTNTLTNAGGILAPGDIGTVGLTTITGNYAVNTGAANYANAAYAVDLGTTAAPTTFQNGTTGYDQTNVTLTAALGGKLNVGLVGGFLTTAPTNANTFTILQTGTVTKSANSLTGTFTNTEVGKTLPVIALNGTGATGLNSMSVTYNPGTATVDGSIVLGNYAAGNTYTAAPGSAWDAAAAASWSTFDPGSTSAPATVASGAIAQFADNAGTGTVANTVTLNSTRNIQGIQFSSALAGHNYTINDAGNSTGAIILDNTANAAAATIADSSASGNSNAINVPIKLNSNLNVSITNAANTLSLGAAIIGGSNSLTLSGSGSLYMNGGTVGTLTVSSGGFSPSLQNSTSGTLTSSGPATLTASSTYLATVNSDSTATSLLSVTGGVALGSAALNVNDLGQGSTFQLNQVYTIISATAPVTGVFSGLASNIVTSENGSTFLVTYDNNGDNVTLTAESAPTPEPASLSLLGLGGLALMRRRRRTLAKVN